MGGVCVGTAALGYPSSAVRRVLPTPQSAPNHASQTPPSAPPESGPSSHEYPESANKYSTSLPAGTEPGPAPGSNKCEPCPAAPKRQSQPSPPLHPSPPARTKCLPAHTTLHRHCDADAAERSSAVDPAARPHPSTRRPRICPPPIHPHFPPAQDQSSSNP